MCNNRPLILTFKNKITKTLFVLILPKAYLWHFVLLGSVLLLFVVLKILTKLKNMKVYTLIYRSYALDIAFRTNRYFAIKGNSLTLKINLGELEVSSAE